MEQTPPLNPPYPQGPRKRGRPRKSPRLDGEGEGPVPVRPRWGWNTAGVPPPPPPPGFAKTPGSMLGRPVVGVVEALLDAGFLICVRADGSDYLYKGIVFRVGCYDPVTQENDIAPDAPMIQRVEFPIPDFPVAPDSDLDSGVKNEQLQISHGQKAAGSSNGSKGREVAAQSAPHGSKGREVASIAAQSSTHGAKGIEVASVAAQSASHGSKGVEIVSVAANSASHGSKAREVASVAAQSALHGSKAREVASVAAQYAPHGSKRKEIASVAAPTARPEIPRGTMVPVMLERTTIPNEVPLAIEPTPHTTPAAHLAASKGKVVQAAKPVPTIRIKKVLPHEQPIQPVLPRAQASEHMVPSRVPPSQSSVPTPAQHNPQPALIPPLPSSKSLEGERTKKMALLLQVVQEAVQQGQAPEAEECSRASLKSSGTLTIKPDPEA